MATDFPAPTLPYCVFSDAPGRSRLGVGLDFDVVDLSALEPQLVSVPPELWETGSLNPLLAAGRPAWAALREELVERAFAGTLDGARRSQASVRLQLAWDVADFVDFYSSRHHAENVGRLFRPGSDPLPENWLHLPAGYHGRSSTVVVDGTPIPRPRGQIRADDGRVVHAPTRRLDYELELGFVIGGSTELGETVPVDAAEEHLFGVVLLNDWTARDIQAWEYVPLGPFLGKSFATSVSAWVMPLAALEAARVPGPVQQPAPLPYLRHANRYSLALELEVWIQPAGAPGGHRVSAVNAADALYWDPAQQLAHLTSNGGRLSPGDLLGTGTVSGPEEGQRGCLLEASEGGTRSLRLGDQIRTFLEDGDTVMMRGGAPGVSLGPVTGRIDSASAPRR